MSTEPQGSENRPTRGRGLLETGLARRRAAVANRLIRPAARTGAILDIGCGTSPYFLAHTAFRKRVGVDRATGGARSDSIRLFDLDLRTCGKLPFATGEFDVVTMLAVVEHLNPDRGMLLFAECWRVLKGGGQLIVTTPAPWSHGLLRVMSKVGLVSREEIEEHVFVYTAPLLGWHFGRAGFAMENVRVGYFEFGLNLWATAIR